MAFVDAIGDALASLLGEIDRCTSMRTSPPRRPLPQPPPPPAETRGASTFHWLQPSAILGSAELPAKLPEKRASDDDLSDASTQCLERYQGAHRAAIIKRVSWNSELCTEASKFWPKAKHRELEASRLPLTSASQRPLVRPAIKLGHDSASIAQQSGTCLCG
ncbi:hypothetical protein AB1Y20_018126 [Prymnesium parvum]|uniref:Uncharacterized protein n=1 Tax=Prymnesium parvum TaxID=97485 RepID=A0AB34JR89_PRYPA